MAHRVAQQLSAQQSGGGATFPSLNPNWKFYERAQPTVVSTDVLPNTTPPTHFSTPLFQNDLNDSFDEHSLLKRVPKPFKKNAVLLLKAFDERPNELTWDAAGNIYVNEQVIPNANIFVLFPYLFRKKSRKDLSGFSDLTNKIHDMGLSHLTNSKKPKVTSQASSGGAESHLNWWYLGP